MGSWLFYYSVLISPLGLPVYQTAPPTLKNTTGDSFNSSLLDQLSAAVETIIASLGFLDESGEVEVPILAYIFAASVLFVLVMWYFEPFFSWVSYKWENSFFRYRAWRNRNNSPPVLEIKEFGSATAQKREIAKQDSQAIQKDGWFFEQRQGRTQATQWFLNPKNSQQRSNDWFLNQTHGALKSELQTRNGSDAEVVNGVESQQWQSRLTEFQGHAPALEEKLALTEARLEDSENQIQIISEQHISSSLRADELAAKLFDAEQEHRGAVCLANESEAALNEAREELELLAGVEEKVSAENADLRLKWEALSENSSKALRTAELANQDLRLTLKSESEAHEQLKTTLVMTLQNMDVMQARLDCQRDSFKESCLEHVRMLADNETSLDKQKVAHGELLATKQSEFDAMFNTLTAQASELQGNLDLANDETKRLRAEATETQDFIENLKADGKSSLSRLEESELQLAERAASLEGAESLRTQLEQTVGQLRQELSSQSEDFAGLEADLLGAKQSLALRNEIERQLRVQLQGKTDGFEKELEARASEFSALESDFMKTEAALAVARSEKEKLEAELKTDVERLEQKLETRSAAFSSLKSELSKSEEALVAARSEEGKREAELQADVERLKQELHSRSATFTALESNLLETEDTLVAARSEKEKLEAEFKTEVERLEQALETRSAAFSSLKSELNNSQEALVAARTNEAKRESELRAGLQQLEQELATRTTKFSSLESDLMESKEALADARAEAGKRETYLQSDVERLEMEVGKQRQNSARLEADLLSAKESFGSNTEVERQRHKELLAKVEGLEQDLANRAAAFANLESELSDAKQALAEKQAGEEQYSLQLQTEVRRIEEVIEPLRAELVAEKEIVAEIGEKLIVKDVLIQDLERELSVAGVNRTNYTALAKKVVSYKNLNLVKDEKLEQLTSQNMRMSDLATEYFEDVKELRGELSDQIKLVSVLKQQLQKAELNHGKSTTADLDARNRAPSKEELDHLVAQRVRKYVLQLKSDFEMRIKRKNSIIRKLRSQAVGSGSDGNSFVTSNGPSNGSELNGSVPSSHRINAPR